MLVKSLHMSKIDWMISHRNFYRVFLNGLQIRWQNTEKDQVSKNCSNLEVTQNQVLQARKLWLRYESSTLILYEELSSPIFQSCQWVSESVSKASVTPDQISTLCNK